MFDFFDEIIEFLSQIVSWANWAINGVESFLMLAAGVSAPWLEQIESFPPAYSWLFIGVIGMLVFDFIRGRGHD